MKGPNRTEIIYGVRLARTRTAANVQETVVRRPQS